MKQNLKQVKKDIKYFLFGKEYIPTEEKKKARAWSYMQTIAMLNDVGAGADENLSGIRQIIYQIQQICLEETGYEILNTAPWEEVGSSYTGWKQNPYKVKKDCMGKPYVDSNGNELKE